MLDAGVTLDKLSTGQYFEANPLMAPLADNPPVLILFKFSVGLLEGELVHHLDRDGHPGWAKAASIIATAMPVGAAIYSLAQ